MVNLLNIRLAQPDDLPAIVDIYNQAIRSRVSTGDTVEFEPHERVGWFHKFDANRHPIYVAELSGKVVGYTTISPYRPGREALGKTGEISFYIDHHHHKTGIGSAMLAHAVADCPRLGKETLLAILLDVNVGSIRLLEKHGFAKWGAFPGVFRIGNFRCGQFIYGLRLGV